MKKMLISGLILLVVLAIPIFSGAQKEEAKAGKDWKTEPTTIMVEADGWILKKFPIEKSAEKFMADHPNINVEVTANQDITKNSYMLNWSTGDADVDLAFGGSASQLAKLAQKNLLESWNDFYTGDFTRDKFLTHIVELPEKDGEYWALPFMAEGMSLQANRALMVEAGLVSGGKPMYPKTLDELYDFSKKTTKGTGEVKDVYGFSWNFTNFGDQQFMCAINALGGKAYNADGSPNLSTPVIVDIFTFIKKVTQDGYGTRGTITDTNAGRSGLKAGKVAMIFEAASRAIEAKPALGDDAIMLPFPGMEKNGTFIYAHYTYIPKSSKVKDSTWAFMKEYILTKEFAAFGAEKFGKLPPMKFQYEGLSADFSLIQEWMAHPGTIGDTPWVEGSKLNALLYELEQTLVVTDITPEKAAERLIDEGSKLDLSVVK